MMEEICLIIKAPNQKYDDLKINCQLSWTIHDLKTFLYKEYPSKPVISYFYTHFVLLSVLINYFYYRT